MVIVCRPTLASAVVSVFLFESLSGVQSVAAAAIEPRFLVPAAAALIPLVLSGLMWLAGSIGPRTIPRMIRAAALLAFGILISPHKTFAIPHKPYRGFAEVADFIQSDPSLRRAAILVSSASDGEGLLISEIVMRYSSSEGFILRASKILGEADWMGRDYKPRFNSADDLFLYLQELRPALIVIEDERGIATPKHQEMLMQVCREHPDYWRSAGTFPTKSPADLRGNKIYVYRRIGDLNPSDAEIRHQMQKVLGRMNVYTSSLVLSDP